jgi:hypothetical protein
MASRSAPRTPRPAQSKEAWSWLALPAHVSWRSALPRRVRRSNCWSCRRSSGPGRLRRRSRACRHRPARHRVRRRSTPRSIWGRPRMDRGSPYRPKRRSGSCSGQMQIGVARVQMSWLNPCDDRRWLCPRGKSEPRRGRPSPPGGVRRGQPADKAKRRGPRTVPGALRFEMARLDVLPRQVVDGRPADRRLPGE